MRTVAFDCETWLITPGNLAPKLVCVTVAEQGGLVPSTAPRREFECSRVF